MPFTHEVKRLKTSNRSIQLSEMESNSIIAGASRCKLFPDSADNHEIKLTQRSLGPLNWHHHLELLLVACSAVFLNTSNTPRLSGVQLSC